MFLRSPIVSDVVMTVIGVFVGIFIICLIVCDQRPAFSTGNRFYIIEGETAQIANTAQGLSVVGASDGLTGIFEQ